MIADAVFCVTCRQDTIPLEENDLCGWCMCDPQTGKPDMEARRREQTRLASQRLRARRAGSALSNDRSAGLDPRKVRRPALQEARA